MDVLYDRYALLVQCPRLLIIHVSVPATAAVVVAPILKFWYKQSDLSIYHSLVVIMKNYFVWLCACPRCVIGNSSFK